MRFNEYNEIILSDFGKFEKDILVKGLLTDEMQSDDYDVPCFPAEFDILQVKYGRIDITDIVDLQEVEMECLTQIMEHE